MALSGINVAEEVSEVFSKMKYDKKQRCCVLKISKGVKGKNEIGIDDQFPACLDKTGDQELDYKTICEKLPPNEGRYLVWDVSLRNPKTDSETDRMVLMSWIPENAPIKQKMTYASSKAAIQKAFNIPPKDVSVTDQEESLFSNFMVKASECCFSK